MNRNIIITVVITIIIGIVFLAYGLAILTAMSYFSGVRGLLFVLVIIAALAGLIYAIVHNMRERILAGILYRNTGFKGLIFPYTALESIIISAVLKRILPCL